MRAGWNGEVGGGKEGGCQGTQKSTQSVRDDRRSGCRLGGRSTQSNPACRCCRYKGRQTCISVWAHIGPSLYTGLQFDHTGQELGNW